MEEQQERRSRRNEGKYERCCKEEEEVGEEGKGEERMLRSHEDLVRSEKGIWK